MKRVFVVSLGMASALGADSQHVWRGLVEGLDVVGAPREWPSAAFGGLRSTLVDLQRMRDALPEACADAPDTAVCGAVALHEALHKLPGLDRSAVPPIPLILGTTSGGEMDHFVESGEGARHAGVGASTDYLAERFGLTGPRVTLSSACTSSAAALIHAALLIRHGLATVAVAGGCDRARQADVAGFHALRALSADHCRPFDPERGGIVIGDGAAMLVLASEEVMAEHGWPPLAELVGFGMSCDAFHATASDPTGIAIALEQAIAMAGVEAADIGYVNCHGTGTRLNDKNEADALALVFKQALPALYATSTKSQTGHLLGTAGAFEAAISVQVLQTGVIPAMRTVRQRDPSVGFRLVTNASVQTDPDFVMSNSLGFGGNNVSLLFKKPPTRRSAHHA